MVKILDIVRDTPLVFQPGSIIKMAILITDSFLVWRLFFVLRTLPGNMKKFYGKLIVLNTLLLFVCIIATYITMAKR